MSLNRGGRIALPKPLAPTPAAPLPAGRPIAPGPRISCHVQARSIARTRRRQLYGRRPRPARCTPDTQARDACRRLQNAGPAREPVPIGTMASLCSAPLLSGHLGLSSPRPARRRAAHRSARPFSARAAPLHQHQDPCCSSASWGPQLTAAHPRARIPSCRQGRRPARPAAAAGPDVSTGAAAESAIPAAPSTSSSGVSEAALAAAWVLLKEVTLKSFRGLGASYVATREKRQALRDAIQVRSSQRRA